jgi:hypothetical protein
MNTTDVLITFDEQGVCDHCRNFRATILPICDTGKKGRAEPKRTVDAIRRNGQGKDFDCILGISSGIDSSYLTYLAKEELGLRPLLFHVDGGWNSELAGHNIEWLVKKGLCFLFSAHREEGINDKQNFLSLMSAINAIAETYAMPVIYSSHPRSKEFIKKRDFVFHPLVPSSSRSASLTITSSSSTPTASSPTVARPGGGIHPRLPRRLAAHLLRTPGGAKEGYPFGLGT